MLHVITNLTLNIMTKKDQQLKQEIIRLEADYEIAFDDWKKGDNMITYLRRKGMDSMADAFEKDYKRLGMLPELPPPR